jgi:glycosyltransferase involved in cell wall biosynthesis
VTCFSAAYPGGPDEEVVDGVRVLRRGQQWSVHAQAWRWLRTRHDRFDRVVDQINTIPFMTPLYVPEHRRRFFIHQLARGYWFREAPGAFRLAAPLGYAAEPRYLRRYAGTRGITVSPSTAADLEGVGIPRDRVVIIPEALTVAPLDDLPPKPPGWRMVVLGRLTPAKYVEEALEVFAVAARGIPGAALDVIGAGDAAYRERLERQARQLGLDVTFHGRVEERRKLDLLAAAHVHVFCSHREGWGLNVSEAAAMGTPTLGFDVPGVRDSVGDRNLLAAKGDVATLGRRARELHDDRAAYEALRHEAWQRTHGMTYEATADAFLAALA